jgi:hypothetical protein
VQQLALALRTSGLGDQYRDPRSHAGERDPRDDLDDRAELSPVGDQLRAAAQGQHLVDGGAARKAGEDDGERYGELDRIRLPEPLSLIRERARETNETKSSASRNASVRSDR